MHVFRTNDRSRTRHIPCLTLLALLLACVVVIVPVQDVSAAPDISRVTPADGELMTTWPRAIAVTFDEQIDQDGSSVRLVDASEAEIPDANGTFSPDGVTMSIAPPSGLDHGTYTIIWEAQSAADGEVTNGYSSFTVGTAADGAVVTVPSTGGTPGGPPQWLETFAHWTSVLGMAALIAIWPAWTLIVRPAVAPIWRRADTLVGHVLLFTVCAVSLALAGSILDLVVHSQTLVGGTWLDKIMNTVGQTRWGHAWTARVAVIIVLGLALGLAKWWFQQRERLARTLIWIPALALPLTFSLASNTWNVEAGRATTVSSNYLHILSTSLWAGSVLVLLGSLMPALRGVPARQRQSVLARALTRFAALTLVTWITLAITGAYTAWLQIGNISALTSTEYGRSAIAKIVAVAVTLIVLAINLVFVRRMLDKGRSVWSHRLRWTLGIQAVLIAVILAASGQMSSQPPARDVVTEQATQVSIPLMLGDRPSKLLIAPGATGVNHLRLEAPGKYLPNETEARLHITLPGHEDLGEKDILLSRVSGNNFEHHGTEFSLDGQWDILVNLIEPGLPELGQEVTHTFDDQGPEFDAPAIPWRFHTTGGISTLLLMLVSIGGLITAVFAGKTPLRKEAGSLGTVALALGVVILLQARYDPVLIGSGMQGSVDPNDLLMVERGELVYNDECLSCHGADLRGDGPLADTMDPPPADFSAPHTYVHSDEDLVYWMKNGKQGTGMPAFDATLTDQEIRDVLAYIQNQQQDMGEESTALAAETCVVAEMSFADVTGSFSHTIRPNILRGTPLIAAADPSVDGDTENELLFTIEQLVACTNNGNALKRLPLFTKAQIMDMFPMGMDARLAQLTTTNPAPLPAEQRVGIDDVQNIRQLADGRLAADVIFTDPAAIGISLDDKQSIVTHVSLVFIWDSDAGAWLIDEIR